MVHFSLLNEFVLAIQLFDNGSQNLSEQSYIFQIMESPQDHPDSQSYSTLEPLIPYKQSKWKKLENSLIFIKNSKKSVEKSQTENPTEKTKKVSKWALLRNTVSIVNFLSRQIYINLELEHSVSAR